MSGEMSESQGQLLAPRNWYPASSALKHRPVTPVDKAAQFVPLLDWQEDRQPPGELVAPHHKLKATPAQQATTVDLHRLSTAAATSDASISSSDEDFDPSRKPRRRLAGGKQSHAKQEPSPDTLHKTAAAALPREQALQASVNKGSIRLADNGARLAGSRQDQSDARQSTARAEGNANQRQDTKGRHLRPRSGRQSKRDAQPRDLEMRGSARPGHGDPNHSPRKGSQLNEQDTRPAKRQRQQDSSRSLQSQRQAWMHKLTSDAAQEAARLEAESWAAEYQPSWTYQDNQGLSQGPFQLAELKAMTAQGSLQGSTMVHDEEAEISIRLDTLIANSQRNRSTIGHVGSPESLPKAAGDAAEGVSDSHQAADAGLTVGIQEAPSVVDDVLNSDIAEQSGEPVDTPVEPVWSPQYSPNRLASLIPENQPPGSAITGSEADAYNGHSEQSSGAVYGPYTPESFHSNPSHSSGMQIVGSMQQLVPSQADSMPKQYQPGVDSQAGVAPIGLDHQAHQQSMRGGHHEHYPTHFPAEHHSQHMTNHDMHGHMDPVKAEPGVSAPSFGHHGGIQPEGHTHGLGAALDMSTSQMPSGAQLSTILSPELSAALAAGMLGPNVIPGGQRPMAAAQHQSQSHVHQQHQDPELHRRLDAHPQYGQVSAAPMHHSVQPDTARQGVSQVAMHRPSLQMMQQPGPRPIAWADDRPVTDPEYRPSRHMAGLSEGLPDRVYYEQGYEPGQEQQEDACLQEEGRGGYEPPLTAEEAEWEWQRQLAEQQDSQEEDVWYDDAPGEHPPAYADGYGLCPQSPSAHWEEEPPEGGWHDGSYAQPGPGSHPGDGPPTHLQPGRSQRQYIGPDGRPRRNRRGGRRHRRPPTHPYAGPARQSQPPSKGVHAVIASHNMIPAKNLEFDAVADTADDNPM
ncbi:hypothetical protein WJX79_007735 [Trebouxia sp. C0005]